MFLDPILTVKVPSKERMSIESFLRFISRQNKEHNSYQEDSYLD